VANCGLSLQVSKKLHAVSLSETERKRAWMKMTTWQQRIAQMILYLYPRIDIPVTIGMNHMLKSPLIIHRKTGLLSVPYDRRKQDWWSEYPVNDEIRFSYILSHPDSMKHWVEVLNLNK
jgi:hypothetical protein